MITKQEILDCLDAAEETDYILFGDDSEEIPIKVVNKEYAAELILKLIESKTKH